MSSVVKYMFDRDFDDLEILKEIVEQEALEVEEEEQQAEVEAAPPPPPTFSEEDMAQARRQGYERGKKEGVAETLAGIEHKIATSLERVASQIETLFQAQGAANEATRHDAVALSMAVVRKLFPKLVNEHGPDEVASVAEEVLSHLFREPRIAVAVNEQVAEELRARLEKFLEQRGFRGDLAIRGETGLGLADCRIEWTGGDAARDAGALLKEIEAAVARHSGVTMSRPEETQG